MTVEQLFVCTQKMKLLEKPVKPIRAISFFVSSSWFAAKSVEQLRVEQSQFEQFTPTRINHMESCSERRILELRKAIMILTFNHFSKIILFLCQNYEEEI